MRLLQIDLRWSWIGRLICKDAPLDATLTVTPDCSPPDPGFAEKR